MRFLILSSIALIVISCANSNSTTLTFTSKNLVSFEDGTIPETIISVPDGYTYDSIEGPDFFVHSFNHSDSTVKSSFGIYFGHHPNPSLMDNSLERPFYKGKWITEISKSDSDTLYQKQILIKDFFKKVDDCYFCEGLMIHVFINDTDKNRLNELRKITKTFTLAK